MQHQLIKIFDLLREEYGQLNWWPAESGFEVCVGAILTQNTNWGNVEKAIANLKVADILEPKKMAETADDQLASLIRPAGYFNVKAKRLKDFLAFLLQNHGGCLDRLFFGDIQDIRRQLLDVRGIGPETADSMILYAGNRPSFVVDAYTRRIFSRIGLVSDDIAYEPLRGFFMGNLPEDTEMFNEYHALIVEHAKQFCRTRPICSGCCLAKQCSHTAGLS